MTVQDLKQQLEAILKEIEKRERENQAILYKIDVIEEEMKKLKQELAQEGIEITDVNSALALYKSMVSSIKEELDRLQAILTE